MRISERERLTALRRLVCDARFDTARLTAGAIGGHLSALAASPSTARVMSDAIERVRDASLRLVQAVHRRTDVEVARVEAMRSLDDLAETLPPLRPSAPAIRSRQSLMAFLRFPTRLVARAS